MHFFKKTIVNLQRLILLFITLGFLAKKPMAGIVYHMGRHGYVGDFNHLNRQTWYIGYNENFHYYNRDMPGTVIDDGVFVAVPDGTGPYNGYSYYEIVHRYTGGTDGGPAALPIDPKAFLERLKNTNTQNNIPAPIDYYGRDGSFPGLAKFHVWRQHLPSLPQGAILPPECLFFFWVSRGGWYTLGVNFIASHLPSKKTILKAVNIPTPEEDLWYERSDEEVKEIDLNEYTQEELHDFVKRHLSFPR